MAFLLFPLSLLISASLLFVIQPMVAKVLLPVYGGTPAVWTICMLFFQFLLLMAYAYAWALSRLSGKFLWRGMHLILAFISLFFLPQILRPEVALQIPELAILKSLFVQLGLPLFVVASSAPLLQFAYAELKKTTDPYFLYGQAMLEV